MSLAGRIRELVGKRFVRDVLHVQTARLVGLGLAFASSVVLVRHLGRDDYNVYALGAAVAALLRLAADFGAEGTILPRLVEARTRDDEPAARRAMAYYLTVVGAMALWLPVATALAAGPLVERLYGEHGPGTRRTIVELAWILSAVGVVELGYRLASLRTQAHRRFDRYALLDVGQNLARLVLVAGGALLGLGVLGMTWAQVATALAASLVGLAVARGLGPSIAASLSEVRQVPFGRHARTGFHVALAKGLPQFYDRFPLLVLGIGWLSDVGGYKILFGLIALPTGFLGPISQPTLVELSQAFGRRDEAAVRRAFFRISRVSLGISAVLTIGFCLVSPALLWLFGEEYLPLLPVLLFMALHPLTAGLGVAIGPFFRTVDRMALLNAINIPLAAAILIGGWFATDRFGIWGAAGTCVSLRLAIRTAGFATATVLLRRGGLVPPAQGR